jgi:hypothetical protein
MPSTLGYAVVGGPRAGIVLACASTVIVSAMASRQDPDLLWFLHVLDLSAARAGGFEREEVALVESAWQIVGATVSSFGWVIKLKDGTRHYVEYICDNHLPEILEIIALPANQLVPELDDDTGVSWYRPDHINHHLGLTGPPPN